MATSIGCRDCSYCSATGIEQAGHKLAAVATLGGTKIVKALKSKCGQCRHPLDAHASYPQQYANYSQPPAQPQYYPQQPMPQPVPQRHQMPQPQPQAQIPQRSPQPKIGVADELLKLKQLLDAGALTQQEFDQQKAKLLGN